MTLLYALDTATERLSLALVDLGNGPDTGAAEHVALHEEAGGALASKALIPATLALLARAGVTLRQVDAFAFGRGPGAFTGLRTACSVCQGFAFGASRPVLPIDSLMLVADDARAQTGAADIWVAMDARMDEIYAASYRFEAAGWQVHVAPALYTLEALDASWQATPPALVAGSAVLAFGARLGLATAMTVPHEQSRAAALARLAQAAWRRGDAVDAAEAQPLYLRDKVALTTAERLVRAAA